MTRADTLDARERLEELCSKWSVRRDRVMETPTSVVAFGVRERAPVVLKVVIGSHEEWNAGAVVAAFAGRGMVRALEYVSGAVLLEAAEPGTRLVSLVEGDQDRDATEVLIGVIKAMTVGSPETRGHPSAEDWIIGFDRYLNGGRDEIPSALVRAARETYLHLCRTQREVRLLHGDLQHYNVLLDQDHGWLAIDPKGIVAEVEFELGAPLRNPGRVPEVLKRSTMERRVDQFASRLGVNAERVLRWTFAQAVLSAIWTLEDGYRLQNDAPILSVARVAKDLAE